jgi:hypothetical protein
MHRRSLHNPNRRGKINTDMGIKLICCLGISLTIAACSMNRKTVSNVNLVSEEDYVKAYKTVVLYGCINEGTKGKFSTFLIENNDLGLFSEVDMIYHSGANIADSLGRVFAKTIRPFDYGDGKGKVPNYSRCVLYALSREIDSVAKESYRQMLKER